MKVSLPSYLRVMEERPLPAERLQRWNKPNYLEKTLLDIQALLVDDWYRRAGARRQGMLQQTDVRVKMAGMFCIVVAGAITHGLSELYALYLFLLFLAVLSGIRLELYLRRTALPVFLMAGLSALPAVINWVTPGEPMVVIYQGLHWQFAAVSLPRELAITFPGMKAAAFIAGRALVSVGAANLLIATTPWTVLTKAFRHLGLPAAFVMVLDVTYRYLVLFLLLMADFVQGRKSRLVAMEKQQTVFLWLGAVLAQLFRLAGQYSHEIAQAMKARGYTGEKVGPLPWRMGMPEVCFLGLLLLLCVSLWGVAAVGSDCI